MNHETLYKKFADGSITPEEVQAFRVYRDSLTPGQLKDFMAAYEQLLEGKEDFTINSDSAYSRMKQRILDWESADNKAPVHRVHFPKITWFRYAAVLLLITGLAILLYRSDNRAPQVQSLAYNKGSGVADIQPGGNKAVLTLADGSSIILDSAANGELAKQGNTKILKSDAGSLTYQAGISTGDITYNTVSTPKGGQYQVTLPDGTKAWLNAASAIQFPTAFQKDRRIIINGEVYLEIAKDEKRPFYVSATNMEIQVLGTSFNVNAYPDEDVIKTTLIEGSIKILKNKRQVLLSPGKQAATTISQSADIQVSATDVDRVIAWKNGYFNFNGADVKSVMREIARWYDIEIIYEGEPDSREIIGKMQRDLTLSQVMNLLKKLGMNYRIEQKKLIVINN